MQIQPSLESFGAVYASGRPQVVWTTLVADLETPVSAMLKLADGRPNSFLLESVEGGAVRGRYSIIGLKPDLIWRAFGNRAEINRGARFDADAFEPVGAAAAHGRGSFRLCRIQHGLADGAAARQKSRPTRHSRRHVSPSNGDLHLR